MEGDFKCVIDTSSVHSVHVMYEYILAVSSQKYALAASSQKYALAASSQKYALAASSQKYAIQKYYIINSNWMSECN